MYMIRDVFRCKPGKSRQIAEMFKRTLSLMKTVDGVSEGKVMLDFVTDYWTVVIETEVKSLDQFEKNMAEFGARPEVREALAGYMDHVEGGHREIFRIV